MTKSKPNLHEIELNMNKEFADSEGASAGSTPTTNAPNMRHQRTKDSVPGANYQVSYIKRPYHEHQLGLSPGAAAFVQTAPECADATYVRRPSCELRQLCKPPINRFKLFSVAVFAQSFLYSEL